MKESIGLTVTINIFIIFLVIAFVFVAGILSYTKAFKAASIVIKQLERYEGYNPLAMDGIDKDLGTIGYVRGNSDKCPLTKNASIGEGSLVRISDLDNGYTEHFEYCIYKFDNDGDTKHYSYGVVTYITVDFYMFNIKFKFPVYAKTRRIYRFTNT